MPLWTILIATLVQRGEELERLLAGLLPQVDEYDGEVTVVALRNDGERGLNLIRHDLLEAATAEYICFVDDDDELPGYYVDEVVARLLDGVDYIGWRMQCILNGVRLAPTFHSLRYDGITKDADGYYRDISHLNPIRRSLAVQAPYLDLPYPEDDSWANRMRPLMQGRTEAFIDRCMYVYHSDFARSTAHPGLVTPGRVHAERPLITDPWFSWHPASTP